MALLSISPNPKPYPLPFLPCKTTTISGKTILRPTAIATTSTSIVQFHPISRDNQRYRTCKLNYRTRVLASIAVSETEEAANYGRILLSDVVVKRRRKVFLGREWNALDIGTAAIMMTMHLLCLFAPFHFNWPAFCTAVALYVVTGLFGITLSFHRQLSHKSFKAPKWLEYLFAYCGVLAFQGNPIDWVSTHRYHHQFCDSERDPHSPLDGFWFSHMNWLFDTNGVLERCGDPNNVGDLRKQPFYRFIEKTYILHPIALGTLLYAIGGLPFVVWGMGVRIAWVYHITWLVNSACHVWGKQAWNTGDLSRNNWWVALLAFGEGWHNNHHAFEFSARHGLEWWQLDMTWYVIRFLQAVGLATDVKLPNEVQKQNMSFKDCGDPNNVGDLRKQPFYRFIEKTYIFHPIALGSLLYALGGFPFIVWGMGVRTVWTYHITWLVNSACHVWGNQAWNTGDLSRNNWWVSLLAFGEGWHNNHHAFEFSARHGLEWWQIDMTWYLIRFLEAVGLATDVKLPNEVQKQRMAFKNAAN